MSEETKRTTIDGQPTPSTWGPDASRRAFLAIGATTAAIGIAGTAGAVLSSTVPAIHPLTPPANAAVQEGYAQGSDGRRLWFRDSGGAGQPVILMHPATGSAMSWPYQEAPFAKAGFRVIAYSRGGYYRSDPAGSEPPWREIDAVIETLKLGKIHLVASAAGAMVALDYALARPERLRSLALTSSGMAPDHPLIAAAWKILLPEGFSQMPPEFRELGPSYRAADPAGVAAWKAIEHASRPPRDPAARTTRPLRDVAGRPIGGFARRDGAARAAFETLASARIRTLLLTGDCDLYMPPSLLKQVARLMPRAQVAIIENAGHAAFWEQPEAFNRAVLAFLRGRSA